MKKIRILSGMMVFLILAMGMMGFAHAESAAWTCTNCGKADNTGNFCSNCGSPKPQDGTWTCTNCGQTGNTGNYCTNCGNPKANDASSAAIPGALAAGDTIVLGTYEQDNLLFNGAEPIEWIVLTTQNGKAMLISKYILDYKAFNEEKYSYAAWSECDLRKWLNDDFYNTVFTNAEKEMIVDYTSESTTDHVFLLSVSEAESLSKSTVISGVSRTEYAKAQGLTVDFYWLRTSGKGYTFNYKTDHAADVEGGRKINEDGALVYREYGVRPCIWIEY